MSRDAHSGDKIIMKHKGSDGCGDQGVALRQSMWEGLPEWLAKVCLLTWVEVTEVFDL